MDLNIIFDKGGNMTVNLTCTQVGALLSFYMDDRLNDQLRQFVAAHLETCPTCRAKYEALKNMVKGLREVHENISTMGPEEKKNSAETPQYNEFKTNLSAYIDNELTDDENIKVKKYVISNPDARKDLEKMYELKKVLHNSFDKTKNDFKDDYSKYILKRIDIQEEVYGSDSFARVAAIFIILFAACTIGAIIIFWI